MESSGSCHASVDCVRPSAREAMEAAEADMVVNSGDESAVDRLLKAQTTFEAVGGLTQDKTVARVRETCGRVVYFAIGIIYAHLYSVGVSRV